MSTFTAIFPTLCNPIRTVKKVFRHKSAPVAYNCRRMLHWIGPWEPLLTEAEEEDISEATYTYLQYSTKTCWRVSQFLKKSVFFCFRSDEIETQFFNFALSWRVSRRLCLETTQLKRGSNEPLKKIRINVS